MTAQEQKLKTAHAEQLRGVNMEKDKLSGNVEDLKVSWRTNGEAEKYKLKTGLCVSADCKGGLIQIKLQNGVNQRLKGCSKRYK